MKTITTSTELKILHYKSFGANLMKIESKKLVKYPLCIVALKS